MLAKNIANIKIVKNNRTNSLMLSLMVVSSIFSPSNCFESRVIRNIRNDIDAKHNWFIASSVLFFNKIVKPNCRTTNLNHIETSNTTSSIFNPSFRNVSFDGEAANLVQNSSVKKTSRQSSIIYHQSSSSVVRKNTAFELFISLKSPIFCIKVTLFVLSKGILKYGLVNSSSINTDRITTRQYAKL